MSEGSLFALPTSPVISRSEKPGSFLAIRYMKARTNNRPRPIWTGAQPKGGVSCS